MNSHLIMSWCWVRKRIITATLFRILFERQHIPPQKVGSRYYKYGRTFEWVEDGTPWLVFIHLW
jgi:hypothetical protein